MLKRGRLRQPRDSGCLMTSSALASLRPFSKQWRRWEPASTSSHILFFQHLHHCCFTVIPSTQVSSLFTAAASGQSQQLFTIEASPSQSLVSWTVRSRCSPSNESLTWQQEQHCLTSTRLLTSSQVHHTMSAEPRIKERPHTPAVL